jgi:diguanylate cyclase (GGDEF)-like protein/PAS domain S-box-containing protein
MWANLVSRQRTAAAMGDSHERSELVSWRAIWRPRPLVLLLLCGLLLVGSIVAGTGLLLSSLRNRAIDDSQREIQNAAFLLAEQTDRAFQALELAQISMIERMNALGVKSRTSYAHRMAEQDVHLALKDKISGLPHVGALGLFDADGNLLNISNQWPAPRVQISDRSYFQALKADPGVPRIFSEPVRDQITGQWTIYLARRIASSQGEFLGVVQGAMELQYFERFYQTSAPAPDRSVSLFRRDGILLARHPHLEHSIGRSFAQGQLFQKILSQADKGVIRLTSKIDGQDRLIAGHILPQYPVVIATGTTVAAALSDWRSMAIIMAAAAALLILVIGGVLFLCGRQVANRIHRQYVRMGTALNNMSQGLVMFDAQARVVVCNQRYLDMYYLSADDARRGSTVLELLQRRLANGTFSGDPQQYADDLLAKIAQGTASSAITDLADGRVISVINQPMADGGWVATHDDITEARLREASFRLLFDNNPVPMWLFDLESTRFISVNDAAVAHYGYSRKQFLSMTILDIRPIEDHDRLQQHVRSFPESQFGDVLWRHQKADGTVIDVVVYSKTMRYEGRAAALVAVHDITERRRSEQELDRARQFLHTIVDNVPAALVVKTAEEHRYTLVNRAFEEFFGRSREDMIGKTTNDIFPKNEAEGICKRDNEALETGGQHIFSDHWVKTTHKGDRLVTTKRIAITNDDGKPQYLLGVIEDVTERRQAQDRIAHMAHHDPLTDLPNRVLLRERLEQGLSRVALGERLAMLYLDLDHFKSINDTLGHSAGDELLKTIAERLRTCVRDVDTVARLGGDEFAIIQTSIEEPLEAAFLAQQIQEVIRRPCDFHGRKMVVDVSIGIALSPNDGTDADELLKKADLALYGAKADGRGTYRFFEPEMDARMRAWHTLENDLRNAIASGQLTLLYQPVVDLARDEISGVEALLRWKHPERGMIPPDDFIPIAEETGLIAQIGEWVLRTACADAARWPSDIRIAVNLSPAQLTGKNFVQMVVNALAMSGIPATRLELEITESLLMQNTFATLATLHQLRDLGVRIAMDDFGTGYSSLSYLRSFPFDKIKIDRSFIGDLSDKEDAVAIVRAVTRLARSFKMATTAEGVETEQQLACVRELGCNEMQGYLFSPPRPAFEISQLLKTRSVAASAA